MERSKRKFQIIESKVFAIFLITLLILLGTITFNVFASSTTVINIDPSSQIVSPGDTFSVNVYCVPSQPMKSFEFKLSFNPLYLQANSVTEGNIFSGYSTYFNSGTIDNTAGTIVDVYGLIIGSGTVVDTGTFVSIEFTAKSVAGTSTVGLYEVGVTNETSYGDISVNNGSVQVDATSPQISNVVTTTSDPIDTSSQFGWVNITCDVTDDVAVSGVFLNIAKPGGSYTNVSMSGINSYYYNSSTAFSTYGDYSYFIWANDESSNDGISSSYSVTISPNWDIDMDGECNLYDLTLVSNCYTDAGGAGWIREDVDNNGEIQILDIVLLSNHYNEEW